MAPYAHRCDGLGKRAGAANLNDMIYAASCEVSHPLPPVRDLAIVDHMVGTEGADTFSFSSDDEVAITAAPVIFAICSAAMETPPVPSTKTVSPGLICPSPTSARQAVTPAVVMVAASAWLQPRGAWVKAVAARTEKWVAKPSMPSPGVPAKLPTGPMGSPSCH